MLICFTVHLVIQELSSRISGSVIWYIMMWSESTCNGSMWWELSGVSHCCTCSDGGKCIRCACAYAGRTCLNCLPYKKANTINVVVCLSPAGSSNIHLNDYNSKSASNESDFAHALSKGHLVHTYWVWPQVTIFVPIQAKKLSL